MNLFQPQILGLFWGVSELSLTIFKRSKTNAVSKDKNSLWLIWIINLSAVFIGIWAAYNMAACRFPLPPIARNFTLGIFMLGLILRWYSIIHLGRFFTTNVAIASDHCVIDTGPYRFIRHPSYTGATLMVLAFCISFRNWASLAIILTANIAATLWRIRIEEEALVESLGEPYRHYMKRTKRLIPLVY
jgi:protein-S-isoprenylcysteine O-methyltransferase